MSITASSERVVATPWWGHTRPRSRARGSRTCIWQLRLRCRSSSRSKYPSSSPPSSFARRISGWRRGLSDGTSDERKRVRENVTSRERPSALLQSILELISRCNTPARDRELIQARRADADAFSSARTPVVRVNAHKMAATATASCVSAKVRIAPAKRAADLARIPRRVSRAAARRARDGKPLPAGPSARSGSARVSRGNAPLTLPIPSWTLPSRTAGAPRHKGHRAFPRRLRREARGTFGPGPNATIRNTPSRNLRKPSVRAPVEGLKLAKTSHTERLLVFFPRRDSAASRAPRESPTLTFRPFYLKTHDSSAATPRT